MRSLSSKLPPGVRRLFRLPVSRRRLLHEMDDEMQAHLTMRVDELRALGMTEADAEAEARRRFGDPDAFHEYARRRADRQARRLTMTRWLAEGAQDLRIALRHFRQAPALAAMVVLTLACCIGTTTAAYGVVRHLLLAPLPYPDGNRIVSLEARSPGDGEFHFDNLTGDLVQRWAARARTVEDLAATQLLHRRPTAGARARGAPDTLPSVVAVTPSFLATLRVRPSLGRGFTLADARPGAPAVALLGERLWRERYGGDPNVIGRAITVDGLPRTIVGVLPRGMILPVESREPLDILVPLDLASARGVSGAFARLRPDVTSAAAERELQAILRTVPDSALTTLHAEVRTLAEQLDPRRRRAVQVLFAAAAGLLLIGCADVAALLLMRGWARRREFAIRQSLGAWRGRLARQLLTESLLLALPSGALGLLVAWLGLRAAVVVRPWTLGFLDGMQLDGATVLWTAAAAVTTGLLFGVGPALLAGRQPLDGTLRAGGAGSGRSGAAVRTHAVLVVGQVALSLMFLSAAGVLARSFVSLVRTPIGYEAAGLVELSVRGAPIERNGRADVVMRTLRDALAATPEVSDVAIGTLPLDRLDVGPTAVDGPGGAHAVDPQPASVAFVSPGYFRVARIRLVRGRALDAHAPAGPGEVVINQALARRLWPGRDALGARLRLGDGPTAAWWTVAGITEDLRMPGGTAAHLGRQIYLPESAAPTHAGRLVLRLRPNGNRTTLRPMLARVVERAGVGVTLDQVTTASFLLEFAYGAPRFALALFAAFAVLAVALAAVGLFGIVAYAVARRTREIGVRVALGADPLALTRTILGQSLRLVAIGCAIGLVGAYVASRALAALVYGVSPNDPAALGGAVVLLVAVALAASALPLRRALRVDPTQTLRAD